MLTLALKFLTRCISVSFILFTFGCDPPHSRTLGLSVDESGYVLIYFQPCTKASSYREANVTRVQLLKVNGQIFGDQDDEILWGIQTNTPSGERKFIVGIENPGFEELVQFHGNYDEQTHLAVVLFRADFSAVNGIPFVEKNLKLDLIYTRKGRYISVEEFRRKEPCP